ncbi:MAG: hypothetical protein JST20_04265 [Bacteroidetes bacterium]|nr:hypothetical protein [Bacteroidota bacterium]
MNETANTSPESILRKKQRRRQTEYIGLTAFQTTFAFMFRQYLGFESGVIISASALSLGWILAVLREKRRILNSASRTRILTDAVESLMLMFLLALSVIVSLKIGIQLLVVQVHLCTFLASYFCGCLLGETRWITNNFEKLNQIERRNYLENLNSSIIFPYNKKFLSSLFKK